MGCGFLVSLAFIGSNFTHDESPYTDRELIQIVENYLGRLQGLYVEYEGFVCYHRPEDREISGLEDGITENFSGTLLFGQPDQYKVDIYHDLKKHKKNPKGGLTRQLIASTSTQTELLTKTDESPGKATIRHSAAADLNVSGSFGRVFLVREFVELLKYNKRAVEYEGKGEVNGRVLDIYAITIGRPPFKIGEPGNVTDRFWVDLTCGGLVFKKETFYGTWMHSHVVDIVAEVDKQGFAFPIHGKYEFFEPKNTNLYTSEEYNILKESLQIGQKTDPARLSVNFPVGTPISDRLKNAVYEFGQDRRPPPETLADAQARLSSAIEQAKQSRDQLAASSWSRDNWTDRWYWPIVGVLATVLLVGVVFLLRRSR